MDYKLAYLLNEPNKKYSFEDIQKRYGLSKDQLLKEIGGLITNFQEDEFHLKHISIESFSKASLELSDEEVYIDSEDRMKLIFLMTYSKLDELSVFHFQDFFLMSKGTISADIKALRTNLDSFNIELIYNRKLGFYLKGDEIVIRRLAKNFISSMFENQKAKYYLLVWLLQNNMTLYAFVRDYLTQTMHEQKIDFVYGRLDEIVYFLAYTSKRIKEMPLKYMEDQKFLSELAIFPVVDKICFEVFQSDNQIEVAYMTTILMMIVQGDLADPSFTFVLQDAASLIKNFERLAAIHFENYHQLLTNIFYHLVPTYFRIRFGYSLPNPLLLDIKRKYRDIFQITMDAFEEVVGKSVMVPESEIGYLTILFGGEIYRINKGENYENLSALIVCPSGISSSLILATELENMFPTIQFLKPMSISELSETDAGTYDIIFSTIPLISEKKVYVTKPLMTAYEKNVIINKVQNDWILPGVTLPNAEEIIAAIRPYIHYKEGVNREKLLEVLNHKFTKLFEHKEVEKPLLKELITEDTVTVVDHVEDWKAAITLAANPLLRQGKIEEKYIDAMIQKVEENGPFIHIGPFVALPHARPEEGVNEIGMSILKVDEPVNLLDDVAHPIKLFICLAAVDNDTHLKALANLTNILSDEALLDRLVNAINPEAILEVINEGEEEE
ncbi:PTS transporter subunit EIIA [Carnobacterium sp. PL24RED07]|uniref:BglG family transcription antiterminator n=1 Tax=unclassified Carnobacterium TaxID=257487 RepID=UPI0013FABD94|nr:MULTISPECIES: BglG family transcription antiterminator [unclassified Carnobacterium]KAF3298648.1 PTS transporter subunit EIIA [Carnobacterium sp. PL26RED25]KAF3303881.1 PTS transporter subunit EIIA [Carnobacterium sp. PL24RED07]